MTLISFDDRDGVIWLNGELIPWRDAKVHVLTHALHYASAVFEGERVYGGEVFELTQHTERLAYSAKVMGFDIPFSVSEINSATEETIAALDIVDGYVRPIAWRGSEMMGVSAQSCRINLAIAAWAWPSYFSPEARLKGIRLTMAKWRKSSPESSPTDTKAVGLYMTHTLSKHEAEAQGFDDALMLDYRGQIAEATGANIFLVTDGILHTPIADCFLDGITRRTVMRLAKDRGYEVIERVIMPSDLEKADEIFLTGTAAEVTPVGEIDGHKYNVGIVTRTLVEDYDRTVRRQPLSVEPAQAMAS
jgi:branched-chain amino acid aminotransferase